MTLLIRLQIFLLAAVCLAAGQCNRTSCTNQGSNCNGFAYEVCSNTTASVTSWYNGSICYFAGHCDSYRRIEGDMEFTLSGPPPNRIQPLYAAIQREILNAYNSFCQTGVNYKLCCPGSIDWPNQSNESATRLAMSNHSLEVIVKSSYGSAGSTVLVIGLRPDRFGSLCTAVSYSVSTTAAGVAATTVGVAGTTVGVAATTAGVAGTTAAGAATTAAGAATTAAGAATTAAGAATTAAAAATITTTRSLTAATAAATAAPPAAGTVTVTPAATTAAQSSVSSAPQISAAASTGTAASTGAGSISSSTASLPGTTTVQTPTTTTTSTATTSRSGGRRRRDLAADERNFNEAAAVDGAVGQILERERRNVAVAVSLPASTVNLMANNMSRAVQTALTGSNITASVSVVVGSAASSSTTTVSKSSMSSFGEASLIWLTWPGGLIAVRFNYLAIGRQN